MVPATEHHFFSRREYHWTPSASSFHRYNRRPNYATSSSSADEMCAASVLISLSPALSREQQTRQLFRPLQQPCPVLSSPPAAYQRSWTNYPALNTISTDYDSCNELASECTSSEASHSEESSQGGAGSPPLAPCSSTQVTKWYPGSVSLSLSEDDDVLSSLHCFMRRYCVEAFSATPEDVSTPRYGKAHGVKVVVGQVGIRCLYCKHRPVHQQPERSVCFPSSLRNIYHSIETWQRRHSLVCTDIAPWVKKSMTQLMESSKSHAGGRRQYWEDSAERLGMVDTPQGVRFSRPPGAINCAPVHQQFHHITDRSAEPVVQGQDRRMVTDFLYLLLEQMESCQFTEEDRTGGRSKIKDNDVGFPGMQCKHCRGKAGFGRYFPSSVGALALANSDRNICNHVQKCRKCPPQVKAELIRLSKVQSRCKNKRGLRKLFFKRVWERIHGTGS
jgi:hypothetical protein